MTKIKKISVLLLLIISIFALAACTNTASSNVEIEDEKNMITVNHRLGETIVAENPERVIVFDYATLDTLDAMGIEVIGLPKSNIPTFLSKFNDDKYEDVGTLFEPDFEKIFELQPDVIFVSARQAEVYDELAKIAPTVFLEVDGADYMNSVTKNLTVLGEIFNKEEIVEAELEKINIAISELKEKVIEDEKNALIVMANDGNISAYGEGSRFGIVHSEFGFKPVDRNISVTKHGDNISFEYILEKNPEYILVIDRGTVAGGSVSAEQIFDNDIIKETDAYKNDKIIYLNSQVWYVASGGMTGTMTMIEDIASKL